MGNAGKYTDRFPIICPAGKGSRISEPVSSLLKEYDSQNFAELFLKRTEKEMTRHKPELVKTVMFEEGVKDALRHTRDSAFALFEQRVMETRFFKRAPLAKSRPAHTVPPHITNDAMTFGDKNIMSEGLYDLVLPPKKVEEVLEESQAGHDLYVLSHQDYNPSEQVRRGYAAPFDRKKCYGIPVDADMSGINVRRVMNPCSSNFVFKHHIQDEIDRRKKSEIGKPRRATALCDISSQDLSKSYGKPVIWDSVKAHYLIYNYTRCLAKDNLYEAVAHFNTLRRYVKKMGNTNFLNDVRVSFKKQYCTWEEVYEVLDMYNIPLNIHKAKLIAAHFKIYNSEGKVNVWELINFLDRFVRLPEMGQIEKWPPSDKGKFTTYREMTGDAYHQADCTHVDPAGAYLLPYPHLPSEYSKASFDSLPEETTVKAVVSPSVPTKYGLSHRDYLLPRSKEEIRTLFTKADFQFTEDEFDKYWEEAKKEWTSAGDMVSVEAFMFTLQKNKQAASH